MKKYLIILSVALGITACGGHSEEQGEAAVSFCDCMSADAYGDFDINWAECEIELHANYNPELFTDESWVDALKEKCPDVAEKMN
jgi:hypothetical protein